MLLGDTTRRMDALAALPPMQMWDVNVGCPQNCVMAAPVQWSYIHKASGALRANVHVNNNSPLSGALLQFLLASVGGRAAHLCMTLVEVTAFVKG